MPPLQPPRAPTDHIRLESFKTLSKLQLIFEFRTWLEYLRDHVPRRFDSPVNLLWDCMSLGAPIGTLLDLLGSPTPRELQVFADSFNFDLSMDDRRTFVESFIHRVNMLEVQGRLVYGEVVKIDDFLVASLPGYTRVLKTINRLLKALQESYPGLFVAPHGSKARRASLVEQLLAAERVHGSRLADVADAASKLYEQSNVDASSLEGFIVNCSRLIPYHNLLLKPLVHVSSPGEEAWEELFMFSNKVFRTNIIGAYRSLCAGYLPLVSFLCSLKKREPTFAEEADMILRHISHILSRTSEYRATLQAILEVSTPTNIASYDSLCTMTFEMFQLSETIDEVGMELRTIWACRHLRTRLGSLRALDLDGLGTAILDDRIMVDPISGLHYSIILFHTLLLCCREKEHSSRCGDARYPTKSWELGPALSATSSLNLVFAISTKSLTTLHCIDEAFFELSWVDPKNVEQTLALYPVMPLQYTQWISNLQNFVSEILHSTSVRETDEDLRSLRSGLSLITTGDETVYNRRNSTGRPWSVIGRKGPHSESSSMVVQIQEKRDDSDRKSVLTPSLLHWMFPTSSGGDQSGGSSRRDRLRPTARSLHANVRSRSRGHRRHQSAKSPLTSAFTMEDLALTPNNKGLSLPQTPHSPRSGVSDSELSQLMDLSGCITREGSYAVAHGGHSDVWKGMWKRKDEEVKVAVKVIRNTTNDPAKKTTLLKRLDHELQVWKQLSHPNVLPLYGTAIDFGPYPSMVCPWMENGSISKYLEECGDILTVSERLRMINEIAEGLSYLHMCSIIHGDLTGANVLLDANLKAQVCDFGLSVIVIETETQSRVSFTSQLGGSVRWADSGLFVNLDGDESEEWRAPVMTYKSDVYSLGSVMLETLSGRPPYHYIATDAQVVIELHKGNKPRRPIRSYVDNGQWDLIQWCWTQPPEDRPDVRDVLERLSELAAGGSPLDE
ncbi:TKL/TKL-ccin protein kinase [Coprinopsis marcescibilis]|uniref:TKL/TKL-ccin protein kinase n=1 Tax=Coprinopsis marcescibilis TaxID=230819 RepID=A0A5C3L3G5_COPMA|nr:TKL/TKL-ccin protein kinase [Coprinopsis marcescibilis]